MKKTAVLIVVVLLLQPLCGAYAMEAQDARQPYAEMLLAPLAGFEPYAAIDSGPDGTLVAVAKAVDGGYCLIRWQEPAGEPDIIPLSELEEEIDAISIAPDGQMLVSLRDASGLPIASGVRRDDGPATSTTQRVGDGPQQPMRGPLMETTLCWFSAAGEETARFSVQSMVLRIAALPGGEAAVLNPMSGIQVYDGTGKESRQLGGADQAIGMAVSAEHLFVFGLDTIVEWSLETGEKLRTIDAQAGSAARAAVGPDGSLYIAGTQGIYRIGKDEREPSHIMSAVGTLIGDPGNAVQGLVVCPDGRIAVLLSEGMGMMGGGGMAYQIGGARGETQLVLYNRLDGTLSDRMSFVITALNDSVRLRKAATNFQRAHPELSVDLRVQSPSNNFFQETPDDDYIRALNTDLLAGGGGDVIILDRLPMRRYIERGILADISHLLPDLGILPGIAEGSAVADDRVYAIPAQFSFQMLWGRQAVLEGIHTLEDIPYAALLSEQRPMYGRTPEEWIRLTYPASESSFRNDKGLVDFESPTFEAYLEVLKKLYTEQDDAPPSEMFGGMRRGGAMAEEMLAMAGGAVAMYSAEIQSLMQLNFSYSVAGAEESLGIVFPSITGEGYAYAPQLLAGVNAQSVQRDNAEEFIRMLLSDDVQGSEQMNGLPTTASALDILFAEAIERSENAEGANLFAAMRMTGGATLTISEPDVDTLASLRKSCDALNTPVYVDETLMGFIIEETGRYFEGIGTAEDAARAIQQRAWFYQNE
ncbi:MAG: extracellular solute-binding protein [Clostridia bacterium]|nr:extracellular solute-binding protein [Clostridia bacterium]